MKSLEQWGVARHVVETFNRMRYRFEANTESYLANLEAGHTPAKVLEVLKRDVRSYRKIISEFKAFDESNKSVVDEGLKFQGVDRADLDLSIQGMVNLSDRLDETTEDNIAEKATELLGNLTKFKRPW